MNSKKTAPAPVLPQVPAHQEDLNFAELGKYLSVSRETARRLCFDGKIPYRKLSTRCYRVSRADAEHYKQSATHHAT